MQGFGLIADITLVTGAVDSSLLLAGDALVIVFLVRGVSGCILSLYGYDWMLGAGFSKTFGEMAAVQCFWLCSPSCLTFMVNTFDRGHPLMALRNTSRPTDQQCFLYEYFKPSLFA